MKNFKVINIINFICIFLIIFEWIFFIRLILLFLGFYYHIILIDDIFEIYFLYAFIFFALAEIFLLGERIEFKKYYFSNLPKAVRKTFTVLTVGGLLITALLLYVIYWMPVV